MIFDFSPSKDKSIELYRLQVRIHRRFMNIVTNVDGLPDQHGYYILNRRATGMLNRFLVAEYRLLESNLDVTFRILNI